MATFYLRTSNYGANKKAASNASYILGEGKYADKDEVSHTEANNLPDFAQNDPVAFFKAADENERERSARGFVFAIPHEAADRNRWASDFAKELCGNAPYLLAVHDKDGNSHAHILMSERTLDAKKSLKKDSTKPVDPTKLSEEKFFSRVNGKDRAFSRVGFVENVKDNLYLSHIRRVAPDYTPEKNSNEVKIGPDLKHASNSYKTERAERAALVQEYREVRTEIATLEKIMLTSKTSEQSTTQEKQQSPREIEASLSILNQQLAKARGVVAAAAPANRAKAQEREQSIQAEIEKLRKQLEKAQQHNAHKQQTTQQPHQPQQKQQQGQGAQLSQSSQHDRRDMDRREQDSLRKEQQSQNQSGKLNSEEQRYRQQEDARRGAMSSETEKAQQGTLKDLQQPQKFEDNRQNDTFYQQAQEKADTPERAHLANWLTQCPSDEYQTAKKVFEKTGGQGLSFKPRLDQTFNTLKTMAAEAAQQQQVKTSAQHTAKSAEGWKKFQRPTLRPPGAR
jgi:hypothetical protein